MKEANWVLGHLRALVGLGEGQTRETRVSPSRRGASSWKLSPRRRRSSWSSRISTGRTKGCSTSSTSSSAGAIDVPLLVVGHEQARASRAAGPDGAGESGTLRRFPSRRSRTRRHERLLAELLEGEVDQELVRRVHGNPLFAEEYARLSVEKASGRVLRSRYAAGADRRPARRAPSGRRRRSCRDAAVVGEVAVGRCNGGSRRMRSAASVHGLADSLEREWTLFAAGTASAVEGEGEYAFRPRR